MWRSIRALASIKDDAGDKAWRASMNAAKAELKTAPEYGGQWTASRSRMRIRASYSPIKCSAISRRCGVRRCSNR